MGGEHVNTSVMNDYPYIVKFSLSVLRFTLLIPFLYSSVAHCLLLFSLATSFVFLLDTKVSVVLSVNSYPSSQLCF